MGSKDNPKGSRDKPKGVLAEKREKERAENKWVRPKEKARLGHTAQKSENEEETKTWEHGKDPSG